MSHHFTCAHCGYEGESDWSDEEAEVEVRALFGYVPEGQDRVVVCDDCFQAMIALIPPPGLQS